MRTKDEYLYMHKILYRRGFARSNEFLEDFNLERYKTIAEILDYHKKFSHAKWDLIYENNKKDVAILIVLLKTGICPSDIVSKILNETKFEIDPSTKKIKYDSYEQRSLISFILNYDLSDKDLQFILNITDREVLNLFDTYSGNLNKEIDIPQHNVERIAEYFCDKFKENRFHRHNNHPKELLPVTYVKSDECIRKIVSLNPDELVITEAINNPHISNELKNELFEMGPRYQNVLLFTFDTACSMYETAIATFDEIYDEKTKGIVKGYSNAYWDAKCVISQLLKTNSLPPSLEIDFAKRIVNRRDRSQDQLTADLFRYTRNPDVLRLAPEIKSKDKEIAYKNDYMPKDVLKDYIWKMCDKMTKLSKANKKQQIPNVWYEHISRALSKIELKDEHYYTILDTGCGQDCVALAQSPFTPEHILKELITTFDTEVYDMQKYYHDEKVKLSAQLNLFFKDNDIDKDTVSSIYKFIQSATYNFSYDENHESNNRFDARSSYAVQSLDAIVKYHDFDSYKKLKKYIDSLAQTFKINESSSEISQDIKHKKYYSNFVNFISKKFNEIESKMMSEKRASDYKLPAGFLSDNEIELRLSSIGSKYNDCSYEYALLTNLHKLEDVFFETVEEIKKRDDLDRILKTEEELEAERAEKNRKHWEITL